MSTPPAHEPLAYRLRYGAALGLFSVAGAAMYPGVVVSQLRRLPFRLRGGPPGPLPPGPADLVGVRLEGISPERASTVRPASLATTLSFLPDLVAYATESTRRPNRWHYPTPPGFEATEVEVADGVRLSCTVGRHADDRPRPCLILVPGMFNSRRQNVMLRMARDAFFAAGYHVVIPDMRDFGGTARVCAAPVSGSRFEGQDVVAVARWARGQMATSGVVVSGFSYGGAITLAAAATARPGEVDGCLAFCPFAELDAILERLSAPVNLGDPFASFHIFYQWLQLRLCRFRDQPSVRSFTQYFDQVVAPYYDLEPSELNRRSSPVNRMAEIQIPTLVVHALDDPVIPVGDTLRLARAARGNPKVSVLITRSGGHFADWTVARRRTRTLLRSFVRQCIGSPSRRDP